MRVLCGELEDVVTKDDDKDAITWICEEGLGNYIGIVD